MTLRLGSMFTDVGALDMAATEVTGGETCWVADPYGPARRVLAHNYRNPHGGRRG